MSLRRNIGCITLIWLETLLTDLGFSGGGFASWEYFLMWFSYWAACCADCSGTSYVALMPLYMATAMVAANCCGDSCLRGNTCWCVVIIFQVQYIGHLECWLPWAMFGVRDCGCQGVHDGMLWSVWHNLRCGACAVGYFDVAALTPWPQVMPRHPDPQGCSVLWHPTTSVAIEGPLPIGTWSSYRGQQ